MKFAPTIALAIAVLGVGTPVVASKLSNSAPADQYFGPLKMSVLGIRDRLNELGKRYHARTITDTDIVHDAKLVEASMTAWQKAYPHDPWIVPTYFHLEQVYQIVQSTNGRTHATTVLKFIASKYPDTHQAHLARLRLAQGFPPLHALPPAHATPNPFVHHDAAPDARASPQTSPGATDGGSPMPAVSGSPAPDASASPAATDAPTTGPSPVAVPSAQPT